MRKQWQAVAFAAAVVGWAGAASAHEFVCEKRVNGQQVHQVSSYPADLTYRFTIRNVHPTSESVALGVEDALLTSYGFAFTPTPPFALAIGEWAATDFKVTVPTYQACLQMAGSDGRVDANIDNVLRVYWELGETQCAARVICQQPVSCTPGDTRPECQPAECQPGDTRPQCQPAECQPGDTRPQCQPTECQPGDTRPQCQPTECKPGDTRPQCQPAECQPGDTRPQCQPAECQPGDTRPECQPAEEGSATRTMGFFKTHEAALSQCLAAGSINLGWITVSTLESALGVLYADPPRFEDGTRRNSLDRFRILLGRQVLVAICNQRLFNTPTSPPNLIQNAVSALASTDCDRISGLIEAVDGYNNSGTDEDFPEGFQPGPATPQHAQSIADDPTAPSNQECGN